jgi:hypothetical protein
MALQMCVMTTCRLVGACLFPRNVLPVPEGAVRPSRHTNLMRPPLNVQGRANSSPPPFC